MKSVEGNTWRAEISLVGKDVVDVSGFWVAGEESETRGIRDVVFGFVDFALEEGVGPPARIRRSPPAVRWLCPRFVVTMPVVAGWCLRCCLCISVVVILDIATLIVVIPDAVAVAIMHMMNVHKVVVQTLTLNRGVEYCLDYFRCERHCTPW